MGTNILGIGQSGLAAAQLGIATAGHNIANAATPGYSRQTLLQSSAAAQNIGGSFVGQGTQVGEIKRSYNEFIAQQVNTSQSTTNYSQAYLNQIQQVNALVSDQVSGISPSLQSFFSSVQNLATSPNGTAGAAARQSVLSSGTALASRVQSLGARLDQLNEDVNNRISETVSSVNQYAKQISTLNSSIESARSVSGGGTPNDLLDQRDYAVTQLSKLINVNVVEQEGKFNIFVGTGQALVIGAQVNNLQTTASPTDPTRLQVSYENNGALIELNEKSLTSGELGGIFAFRSNTLDVSRNSLGRVAIGIATELNAQHKLGQDLNGQTGGNLFSVGQPSSTPSGNNTSSANIAASFDDVGKLTTSDYRVQYLAGVGPAPNYFKITRLSDGVVQTSGTLPAVMDGVNFDVAFNSAIPAVAVPPNVGDEFIVKPTAGAASKFAIVITDTTKLAASVPVGTSLPATNTGSGRVDSSSVNSLLAGSSNSLTSTISAIKTNDSFNISNFSSPVTLTFATGPNSISGFPVGATVSVTNGGTTTNYPSPATVPYNSGDTISFNGVSFSVNNNPTAPTAGETFTIGASLPITPTQLTYNTAGNNFTGFPATANVTVKNGSNSTTYPAGSAVPYIEGSTVSFNGLSFQVSGAFANGDIINVTANSNATGDSRNALLLAGLQTKNSLVGDSTSFQGAYGQFVSLIGNKTQELIVTSTAENNLLAQTIKTQQSESGVNLDEEAANLLRYQQAYQAAGQLMKIASQLFDVLLALG